MCEFIQFTSVTS